MPSRRLLPSNRNVTFVASGVGFSGSGNVTGGVSDSGTLIYKQSVSGTNAADAEITSTMAIKSGGGTFMQIFRADALADRAGIGNYTSVNLEVPANFSSPGQAALSVYQCVNGSVTWLGGVAVPASDGMVVRSVIFGPNIWIYANGVLVGTLNNLTPTTGNVGIGGYGMTGGSGFTSVKVGHHDSIAPGAVISQSVVSSVYPTAASLRWQGVVDDANGVGLLEYAVYRDGVNVGLGAKPEFTDNTVQPGGSYVYTVYAIDFHGNYVGSNPIPLTTPPAGAIDPRRPGVRPLGNYWGGAGEQIDTLSGNLNYTLPLLSAQGRGSWSVPVVLSYNSQNWRQDGAVSWNLGNDVGYGYGWKLLAGSVTPYYTGWYNGVDHYVFTDSSGPEYRLCVNHNGVLSSSEGLYAWFDSNTNGGISRPEFLTAGGNVRGGWSRMPRLLTQP